MIFFSSKLNLCWGALVSALLFAFVMIVVEEYARGVRFALTPPTPFVHLIPTSKPCDCGKICSHGFKCHLRDCPTGHD